MEAKNCTKLDADRKNALKLVDTRTLMILLGCCRRISWKQNMINTKRSRLLDLTCNALTSFNQSNKNGRHIGKHNAKVFPYFFPSVRNFNVYLLENTFSCS